MHSVGKPLGERAGLVYTRRAFMTLSRGNKIGFALLGVAYLISLFLVTRRAAQEVTSDRITLRLSQWQLESGVRESIDAIIRRYEQLNPHVHVVQIAVPGGATYLPWIQAQMVGGTGPDIAEYSWPWPDTARNFSPITNWRAQCASSHRPSSGSNFANASASAICGSSASAVPGR